MDILPRLPSDILRAAFPDVPRPEWLKQASRYNSQVKEDKSAIAAAMRYLKDADPHYYNSVVERHTKSSRAKPAARNIVRKSGFLADDGSVYVNKCEKTETKRAQRIIEETEAKIIELEAREKERLERLKQAIRSGDIIYTPEGIFETKACRGCGTVCKKVQLDENLCPGSILASNATTDAKEAAHAQTKLVHFKVSNRSVLN